MLPPTLTLRLSPTVTLDLVLVRAGSFIMGDEQEGVDREKPEHLVRLTQDFYLGRYPVTQAQWAAVTGADPSGFSGTDRPVENVSWNDVMMGGHGKGPERAFVASVSSVLADQRPVLSDWHATLPTEAQWEYAAKGGHLAPPVTAADRAHEVYPRYSGGEQPSAVAWSIENNGHATVSVGLRQPNALGLYGMSGNVWEWCRDTSSYGDNNLYQSRVGVRIQDPLGEDEQHPARVLRGGSWNDGARFARPASWRWNHPVARLRFYGFRLCLVPPVR